MRITRKLALEKALEANEGIHEELFNQIDLEIFKAAKSGRFHCQIATGSREAQEAVMNEYKSSGFGAREALLEPTGSYMVIIHWRM